MSGWLALAGAWVARATPVAASVIALVVPRVPTTYYVDNAGTNGGPGTSPGAGAWQTCAHVNSQTFVAGDQIIFTAGQTFVGPLTITNSGAAGNYICIGTGRLTPSTAGTGRTTQASPAIITCPDGGNGINVNNAEYVSLDNLHVSGSGVNTSTGVTTSTGFAISLHSTQATNKLNGVRVTACSATGCKDGIVCYTSLAAQKGYDDLSIWGCVVHACQRVGIIVLNNDGTFASGSATQNSNVYVGYCQTYDLPGLAAPGGVCGSGIDIRNTTTGTVEFCTAHDINIVGDQGSGGTSGFSSARADGILYRGNEAYNIYARQLTPIDGVGIDFETGAVNCTWEHGYVHDCDGAGYLCGSGIAGADATDNVVRFSVFARNAGNQQAELYNFGCTDAGTSMGTFFYNNTIYASHGHAYDNGSGHSTHSVDDMANCIVVSKAGSKCLNGTMPTGSLNGNLYYAIGGGAIAITLNGVTYTTIAGLRGAGFESYGGGTYGVNADPRLSAPSSGVGSGFLTDREVSNMAYFDLLAGSPAINGGLDLEGILAIPHDFHGVLCAGRGANIGACLYNPVQVRLPVRIGE